MRQTQLLVQPAVRVKSQQLFNRYFLWRLNILCPVNNRWSRLSRRWTRTTLPTDSGFPLLCPVSCQLIPTSPWKTTKVIKAINIVFLFASSVSIACYPEGSTSSLLLTGEDPISCTDFLMPRRCKRNVLVDAKISKAQRYTLNMRVIKVWGVFVLSF